MAARNHLFTAEPFTEGHRTNWPTRCATYRQRGSRDFTRILTTIFVGKACNRRIMRGSITEFMPMLLDDSVKIYLDRISVVLYIY